MKQLLIFFCFLFVITSVYAQVTNDTTVVKKFKNQKKPEYPGGETELVNYIAKNLKYPEKARKSGTQGIVYVAFIIKPDGSVEEVRVRQSDLKGKGKDKKLLENEAMRIIQSLPKWTPGEQDGKKVTVNYSIPIKFTIR